MNFKGLRFKIIKACLVSVMLKVSRSGVRFKDRDL